jgi:hypothetical protein
MSTLAETQLRRMIREHAGEQEGFDAELYDRWEEYNEAYFEGKMVPALILMAEPSNPRRLGDCGEYSGLAGVKSQIRIRPSLLNRYGKKFVLDVLLHEMCHQFAYEISGEHDDSWAGHGPAFSAKANEIGQKLGLPPVRRTCKSRDGDEPSPSQWPHDVRPASYYLGAYVPASLDGKTPARITVPTADPEGAARLLREAYGDRISQLRDLL